MGDSESLDWGPVTPEGYDGQKREALQILNMKLVGEANRRRAVRFVTARVVHFSKHLPENSSQRLRFDLRGQLIGTRALNGMRQAILDEASKHGIVVTVEFLTN